MYNINIYTHTIQNMMNKSKVWTFCPLSYWLATGALIWVCPRWNISKWNEWRLSLSYRGRAMHTYNPAKKIGLHVHVCICSHALACVFAFIIIWLSLQRCYLPAAAALNKTWTFGVSLSNPTGTVRPDLLPNTQWNTIKLVCEQEMLNTCFMECITFLIYEGRLL